MSEKMKNVFTSSPFNLSLAMIIVGSSVICGRVLSVELPLFLASEIRFLLSVLLFLPFGIYKRQLLQITRQDWPTLGFMAFCGQVVFTVLLLLGLRYTSGVTAGTLTSTSSFFMALIARFVLKERYSKKQIITLLMTLTSIFLLGYDTFVSLGSTEGSQLFGNLMVLGAVVGESCFLLLGKKLKLEISGLQLTAILSLLGAIICLPPAIYEATSFNFYSLTGLDLLAMLYLGWIYTNLAYLCWFHGLQGSSGANAGLYVALMPLSATFFSLWLMHEAMNSYQAAALLLAIGSILLANYRKGKTAYENKSKGEDKIQTA